LWHPKHLTHECGDKAHRQPNLEESTVSPMAISWIAFACVFGGALLGMFLRGVLPEHHQSADSKDVLKLLLGLIGTMAALVLGLLIATAESSYATRSSEFTQMSANIILFDRVLAHYGPETKDARALLQRSVARGLHRIQPENGAPPAKFDPTAAGAEILYDKIQQLTPQNDAQRSIQAQALTMAINLAQTRWLLFEQSGSSIPMPFLVVLVFWLSVIFTSFGFFAPRNATVVVALLLGALSVSAAIFLILELAQPFPGADTNFQRSPAECVGAFGQVV
jgi:hypothetical protein